MILISLIKYISKSIIESKCMDGKNQIATVFLRSLFFLMYLYSGM